MPKTTPIYFEYFLIEAEAYLSSADFRRWTPEIGYC